MNSLTRLAYDVDDAARNIYYAMQFLPESHPARVNLKLALKQLGVTHPTDVLLNSRAADYKEGAEYAKISD